MKPIIGLDIDGVIMDTYTSFVQMVNDKYHTKYRKEDISEWGFFQKTLGLTVEQEYEIFHEVWKETKYPLLATEPDIAETIRTVKEEYRVSLITKRGNYESVETTAKWLRRHGIEYHDYICVFDNRCKCDFPWDILVDDGTHNVHNERNRRTFLYSQPWNKNLDYPHRINSLKELLPLIRT